MLITDKHELVRLKLTHDQPGELIEFAVDTVLHSRFHNPIYYIDNPPDTCICVLVRDYYGNNPLCTTLTIVLLEFAEETMKNSQYSPSENSYPIEDDGDPDYILKKWKIFIKDELDVNY